jgi:hypothetical protein
MVTSSGRKIEVQLEGSAEDGGAVRLDDLHQFLHNLRETLQAVEREVTEGERPSTVYRVVGLSYKSPARVEIQACPEPDSEDVGPAVVSRFGEQITQIIKGVEPPGIEPQTLQKMLGLCAGYRRHLTSVRFLVGEEPITLPRDFETTVRKMLGRVFRAHGNYRGKVEQVNVHEDPPYFHIYPAVGRSRIRCNYKRSVIGSIGPYIERTVDVFGVLKYRGDSDEPFEIDVEEVEILPLQSQLPTTDQIVGSMPGVTDDLDVVTYLRKRRDEEEAA